MSGMEVIGLGLGLAGTFAQSNAQRAAGRESAAAARFEAAQLENRKHELEVNESIQRTAADQAEARRTEELTANLETIQAIRSGRGVGLSSPTGQAIFQSTSEDVRRDIGIEKTNILNEADSTRRAAWSAGQEAGMARRKAKYSLYAGNQASSITILSGLGKAASGIRF
jgi:hypothetical protein